MVTVYFLSFFKKNQCNETDTEWLLNVSMFWLNYRRYTKLCTSNLIAHRNKWSNKTGLSRYPLTNCVCIRSLRPCMNKKNNNDNDKCRWQKQWRRCPLQLPGAHCVACADVNAEIGVFWGRWSGGGGRGRRGDERREDGEGVRPGCWCEWGEGRKRGEKISIYGKKTEGSVIEGAFTLRELSSGARRGIRQLVIAHPYPRISVCVCVCVFCTCIPGGEGRRTRQRREEKMLWSATCRDVERERRESQGGGGRRYVKKRCLFCGEYAFHLEVLWECGGRVINRTVWRSPETSGGVGFFDRRRERDGRSSRRWS